MSEVDYLNQRTTNINIRISPMLKTQLIDSGARQGLNLSDYIMHLLLTEMSGGNIPKYSEEEYIALEKKHTKVQELLEQLEAYENLTQDADKYIGHTYVHEGKSYKLESRFDILKAVVECIKFQKI
jgi:hypothetical protein